MTDPLVFPVPAPAALPLAGRDRELSALRAALASALSGRGSLVLIGGEAGIGKTALAEAVCAESGQHGATVLVGRSYDLGETPPYGPWAEALARVPGEPAPLAPFDLTGGVASRAALFTAVREYVAALAAIRPVVLLLDDLHWADPASLDLLRFLGRGIAGSPVLLLATYRADELAPDHPLAALLPALVREARADQLDLPPLDAAAVEALVAARYALDLGERDRLVRYLVRRGEGNALFLGELLRTLEGTGILRQAGGRWALGDLAATPVPPLLRQVIAGRLARLGDEDRRLLAVAAVLGQELPFALWAAVGEAGEGALLAVAERAIAARVLEATDAGVRFAHALVREVLYDGVLSPRRRAWHRRAGEVLAAMTRPDPDAVAYHFQRAGDARAATWLVRAGDRADLAHAWQTAEERFEAALGLLDGAASDAGERAWLLLRLARLQRYTDSTRMLRYLDAAWAAICATDDALLAAYGLFLAGHFRCFAGSLGRGVREMAAGVDKVLALPVAQRERLASAMPVLVSLNGGVDNLILWQALTGHFVAARARVQRPRPGDGGADLPRPDAHLGHGIASAALGDPAAARRSFRRAVAEYRAAGHHAMLALTLDDQLVASHWVYHADDRDERAQLVAELRAAADHARDAVGAPATAMMAHTLFLEGIWDDIRSAAETPILWTSTGGFHLLAPWARVLALGGESARAWAAIRQFLPQEAATPPGEAFFVTTVALQRVAIELALGAGDRHVAGHWLAAHDRWLAWGGAVPWRSEAQALWARYHRLAGDLGLARRCADHALALANEPRQPLALLVARRLLGELDTAEGHHDAAEAHLAAALALVDACAVPYERALTLLALAELRIAMGERDDAGVPLTDARTILASLDARPALARADALVLSLEARSRVRLLPDGLSPREAGVLGLLAAGKGNDEIARALFLSPRTIQRHLANAYLKIGVHNRAAATAYALRHGLA